jgi:hypothetical protein
MKKTTHVVALVMVITILVAPKTVQAHCDTLNGPVVQTAREALGKGDVTPVLKWVKPDQEGAIRSAFAQTLAVRKQSKEAGELADMYFFETVVRIHREGEGAPYTGLKPGEAVEPGIEAADKAVEAGSHEQLIKEINRRITDGIADRFRKVIEAKRHMNDSVEAGREYVEAYVGFIHYYERLFADAQGAAAHSEEHQH